jgi:GT2 family glycosyltransferase
VSSKEISVIIPTYMAGDLLLEAVKSVRDAALESKINVKIIVIDNSPEKSDQFIGSEVDIYHSLPTNPGFGAALNQGFFLSNKSYESSWFLILNPDAKIDEAFFKNLTNTAEFQREGSKNPISPLICFDEPVLRLVDPKVIQLNLEGFQIFDPEDSFSVFDKKGEPIHFTNSGVKKVPSQGHLCLKETDCIPNELILRHLSLERTSGEIDLEILKLSRESFAEDFIVQNAGSEIYSNFSAGDLMTGWLASAVSGYNGGPRRAWCGAGVLIPRIYLDINGAFDERFFLYYEDTEFSYRGILAETLPILCPNLIVRHKHSALTGKNSYSRSKAIWRSRATFVSLTSGKSYGLALIALISLRAIFSLLRRQTTFRHFLKFLLPEIIESVIGFLKSILPEPNRRS